jgi:tape measure domain-containing protein
MNTLRTTADLTGPELDRAMAAGSQRIKELERDLRAATGQLTLMDRASSALKTTVGQFAAAFGVVQIVQSLGTAFIESNKKMEQMRLGFGALYKDANVSAQQIDFLRKTANDAGVSFGSISESFLRFSASTQAANIPLAQTNALFAAVTRASATLGLSGDKVSHILDALSQMAGKGVVSMEELRQQMGDSLPGALSLVAKGLGITDQQLVKLVQSGGLLARDLFPALTKALEGMQTPVNTLSATWERFKNVLSTISTDAADTGVWDVLKMAIATVGVAINGAAFSIGFFIDSLVTAGRIAGDFANGDLTEAGKEWDRYSARQERAAIRLIENAKLLYGVGEATNYSTGELQTYNGTVQQTTQATAKATAGATAHAAAMTQGAAATQVATQATQALGTAAVQTGASVVQLGVRYAETSAALALQTQVVEKLTKAREIEGKSLEAVVRLSGNEVAALDAARQAASNNLDSHTQLLAARNAEATALRNYIEQLKEEVRLHGDPGGVRAKDIQDRQKRLETLDAEAEREKQVVDSLKVEVASRQLARQSYDDNSKSLDLLRQVYLNTNDTLKDYEALQKQGFATQAQVDEARIRAGAAEGLYRDALNDTTKAMERQIELSKDRNVIEQAQIGLDKARASALGDRLHDSNLQRVAQVEGLELERDARMKNASVMEQESNARLKDIDTQRQAQIELGTWNEQKQPSTSA